MFDIVDIRPDGETVRALIPEFYQKLAENDYTAALTIIDNAGQKITEAAEKLLQTTTADIQIRYQQLITEIIGEFSSPTGQKLYTALDDFGNKMRIQHKTSQWQMLRERDISGLRPIDHFLVFEVCLPGEQRTLLQQIRNRLFKLDALRIELHNKISDAIWTVLNEVKPYGEVEDLTVEHLGNNEGTELEALYAAAEAYPAGWISKLSDYNILRVTQSVTGGGFYSSEENLIGIATRISDKGYPDGTSSAIHELAHAMERAIPALQDLENAFLTVRKETKFDAWVDPYFERVYDDGSLEIFAAGIEALFVGAYGSLIGLGSIGAVIPLPDYPSTGSVPDDGLRNFVLGTLSLLE